MVLSYIYAGWGNVPIVAALFRPQAAVLAIVIEAVVRMANVPSRTGRCSHSLPLHSSAFSF